MAKGGGRALAGGKVAPNNSKSAGGATLGGFIKARAPANPPKMNQPFVGSKSGKMPKAMVARGGTKQGNHTRGA